MPSHFKSAFDCGDKILRKHVYLLQLSLEPLKQSDAFFNVWLNYIDASDGQVEISLYLKQLRCHLISIHEARSNVISNYCSMLRNYRTGNGARELYFTIQVQSRVQSDINYVQYTGHSLTSNCSFGHIADDVTGEYSTSLKHKRFMCREDILISQ